MLAGLNTARAQSGVTSEPASGPKPQAVHERRRQRPAAE